jgi:hypothetical protein
MAGVHESSDDTVISTGLSVVPPILSVKLSLESLHRSCLDMISLPLRTSTTWV